MGCWNQTCGLTQLPIRCGEEVSCYVLVKNKYAEDGGGGFCYSNGQYKPMIPPIVGKYNDYGSIENIDSKYDYLYEYLMSQLKNGNLKFVDEDAKEPKNLEEFIYNIERGYINTKEEQPLGFMLIHKELDSIVIDEIGNRKPYNNDFTIRELLSKEFEKIKNYINNLVSEDVFKMFEARENIRQSTFGEILSNMTTFINYIKFIKGEELIDLALMSMALSYSRKFWSVQTGAGSQSNEFYLNKLMGDWVSKKTKDFIDGCKEDEDDIDEDDIIKETSFWYERF